MATTKKAAKTPAKAPAKKAAAPKPAAKPVVKKAAPPKAPGAQPKAAKADKPKKPKLVRDSFTIPKPEYTVLDDLKQRAAKAGVPAKKSEVLRAGIKALSAMGDAAFEAAMRAVPAVKTGRPAKS
jgi:hypothetical protein